MTTMEKPLTSRERVRLALAHQQTDRVPIAMVCAGINPPAKRALETYLQAERGLSVDEYLRPLIDIQQIDPDYIGLVLPIAGGRRATRETGRCVAEPAGHECPG